MSSTTADVIIYEHPLNERVRLFLRLQHLFHMYTQFQSGQTAGDTRTAVDVLIEITSILTRSDLKSEVIKELERHLLKLAKLTHSAGINREKLATILNGLEEKINALNMQRGQLGVELREHEFFKTITQRSGIPGGTCDFDLPIYHLWLQGSHAARQEQLDNWFEPLLALRDAVDLLVNLIRTSSSPHAEVASEGFYQQSLDKNSPVQMLRIAVPIEHCYFIEVSGGKHRFSIRFLHFQDATKRPNPVTTDVAFELTTCVL